MQRTPVECFILRKEVSVQRFKYDLKNWLRQNLGISNIPSFSAGPANVMVGSKNQSTRDEWLKETLQKIPAGSRILDAGAGELKYKSLCSHLVYVSQDFAQYTGQGDGKGLQTGEWDQTKLDIVSDITSIPEPGGSFDAVMCVEVLEHVPHPVDALRELARLLKAGGYLIVTAPFCSATHMAPYFYQTGYSRYFYEYWLDKFDFEILDLQHNGNYFEYLAQEIRRIPQVSQDYAQTEIDKNGHLVIRQMLSMLSKLSEKGDASSEFLCFGMHIFAKKA
jgi:ubiquinone/menaquinone biosynthesis C-methylase UbiE